MKILVDRNISAASETFSHHGEVIKVDGRKLCREQLREARVLIVRSVTCVGSNLLENTAVEFVGSATIGTDHLDIPWLQQHGIRWASAPGCNADAAAQYTLAMMLLSGQRLGFRLRDRSVGIVGHGNVGSRVHRLLKNYGVAHTRVCDPPLAEAGQAGLCGMEEIAKCGVISFHVPLTLSSPYATMNMVDEQFLSGLPPGTLLVNTSRGKVTDGRSLGNWLESGQGFAALDVWPDEPNIGLGMLNAVTVATPHVAGYSLDGKLRATEMVYRQFCDWLHIQPVGQSLLAGLGIDSSLRGHWVALDDAILAACPVSRDDAQLRKLEAISPQNQGAQFDKLRQNYPERRDFSAWQVPENTPQEYVKTLQTLGFH